MCKDVQNGRGGGWRVASGGGRSRKSLFQRVVAGLDGYVGGCRRMEVGQVPANSFFSDEGDAGGVTRRNGVTKRNKPGKGAVLRVRVVVGGTSALRGWRASQDSVMGLGDAVSAGRDSIPRVPTGWRDQGRSGKVVVAALQNQRRAGCDRWL